MKTGAYSCPACGSILKPRLGSKGPFLACSAYPNCRVARAVDAEGRPVEPPDTGLQCDRCGSPMLVKHGPRGPFLGCSTYPRCRATKPMIAGD